MEVNTPLHPSRAKENLVITGEDEGAALALGAEGSAGGIICNGDATVQNLTLGVNMVIIQERTGVEDNWRRLPPIFGNGKYTKANWHFIDSKVTVSTDGRVFGNSGYGKIGSIEITGCEFLLISAFEYINSADTLTITNSTFHTTGKSRLLFGGSVG